jgi:hypothetical protein
MAVLPIRDRRYLADHGFDFAEFDSPQRAIVLKGYELPAERYEAANADVLIVLPAGYPDSPPDMFYVLPWLRLTASRRYPNKADHAFEFNDQSWQRWSRHNNEWRPGIDGIWTMLRRIQNALEVAA